VESGPELEPFRRDELAEVRTRALSSAEGETDERRKRALLDLAHAAFVLLEMAHDEGEDGERRHAPAA